MTITLEAIKTEQSKIAKMIATLEAQTTLFPLTVSRPELNKGERYIGAIISADGTKRHHVILLPGEKESCNWKDATAWAESIGGELPDRCEGALVFATAKDEFKEEWYWTREQHASGSSCAWCQYFSYGYQDYGFKLGDLRARAVRRLEI